jgi:hypothetical protein
MSAQLPLAQQVELVIERLKILGAALEDTRLELGAGEPLRDHEAAGAYFQEQARLVWDAARSLLIDERRRARLNALGSAYIQAVRAVRGVECLPQYKPDNVLFRITLEDAIRAVDAAATHMLRASRVA